MLARIKAKLSLQRIQLVTAEYGNDHFSLKSPVIRLNVVAAAGPAPPVAANTSEVKEAISTSLTLCSYVRLLLNSCFLKAAVSETVWFEIALGLKTRTSKNALSNLPPQRPQALGNKNWVKDGHMSTESGMWRWLHSLRLCSLQLEVRDRRRLLHSNG